LWDTESKIHAFVCRLGGGLEEILREDHDGKGPGILQG
jgi:hypothetical protein